MAMNISPASTFLRTEDVERVMWRRGVGLSAVICLCRGLGLLSSRSLSSRLRFPPTRG